MTDEATRPRIVIPGNAQHIGARNEQQDSFGFSAFDAVEFVSHAGFLSVVADGMGGLALGKDSSATAVRTFLATYEAKEPAEKIPAVLDRGLHAANRAVNRQAAAAGVEGEAGTTLVAVVIHDGKLYRVAAGDSRIYLFRQGILRQLTTDYNYGRILDRGLHAANREVNRQAAAAGVEGEAGTTLVAVVIHDGKLYRVAAGDSRIYLFRQGILRQLTTDYNYGRILDRMVEKGEISAAEADSHPSRAALTSYLGKQELDDYDQPADPPVELMPGDKILLASDGLFGFLPEEEIIRLLAADPQPAAEALVQATIERQSPYQDNITVAVLGYDLPPPKPLAETQRRSSEPKATVAAGPKKEAPPKKPAGIGKWTKVALLVLALALAGFFGGRYFGEQGLKSEPPPAVGEQPAQGRETKGKMEKAPEKLPDKTPEKTPDKTPDKAATPAK